MEQGIILRKSDIEKYGRKIMKKVYDFLNDDYILTFKEMEIEKNNMERQLIMTYYNIYDFKKDFKYENLLESIKNKINNESLDIDLIFNVLDNIELEFEIEEDLYCEKKAFTYIYQVFDHYYSYLKD